MPPQRHDENYRFRPIGGGAGASDNRIFNAPGVVMLIAAINILVFILMVFGPKRAAALVEIYGAVVPARMVEMVADGHAVEAVWRLIAHQFMHASIAHIAFNMLWLLAFGAPVARRMGADNTLHSGPTIYGAALFFGFYLLCGAAGAMVFIAGHTNEYTIMVGASGAVSGLLGALCRFAFNRTSLFGADAMQISPLFSRPVMVWSLFMIAFNNPVSAALLGAAAGGVSIAWEAHLGGFFFGLLTYPLFESLARSFR